jgi:hypothetical protein
MIQPSEFSCYIQGKNNKQNYVIFDFPYLHGAKWKAEKGKVEILKFSLKVAQNKDLAQ